MLDVCPSTSEDLKVASVKNRCTDKFLYHCLRNEKGGLTEKCLDPSWIQKGYCAGYNTAAQRIDAEKCNEKLGICPENTYLSKDVTSYSACVKKTATNEIPASMVTNELTTTLSSRHGDQPRDDSALKYLPAIIVSILIIVAIIIASVICFRRKHRRGVKNRSTEKKNTSQETAENLLKGSPGLIVYYVAREHFVFDCEQIEGDNMIMLLEPEGDVEMQKIDIAGEPPYCISGEKQIKVPCEKQFDTEDNIKDELLQMKESLPFFEDKNYTETAAGKNLRKNLLSRSSTIIVGKPGSGKTSLAWHTCSKFHRKRIGNDKFGTVIVCSDVNDIDSVMKGERVIFAILDNYFERLVYYPETLSTAMDRVRNCPYAENKDVVFVFTIATTTYDDINIMKEDWWKELSIIDLDEEDSLHIVDVGNILEAHDIRISNKQKTGKKCSISEETLKKIKDSIPYMPIGFPLATSLYATDEFLRTKGTSMVDKLLGLDNFFKSPVKVLKERICMYRDSTNSEDKNRYCTLIYAMLKGGKTCVRQYDNSLLESIAAKIKTKDENRDEPECNVHDYQPMLLVDCFLLKYSAEEDVEFRHECLLQVLFVAFGNRLPRFVIAHCDPNILAKYVRTKDMYDKSRFLVIDKSDLMEKLIERLLNEDIDIKSHVMWKDSRLQDTYRRVQDKQLGKRMTKKVKEEDASSSIQAVEESIVVEEEAFIS